MASRQTILNSSVLKGAKKKSVNKDQWKENVAKSSRQSGQEYKSKCTGKVVPGVKFSVVKTCCKVKCFENVSPDEQKRLFELFYDNGSKKVQDTYLASCMNLCQPQDNFKKVVNPKKYRDHVWKYSIKSHGSDIPVCRTVVVNLYQVGVKRLRLIQTKIVSHESLDEKRGKHGKQRKISPDVYTLALEHLKSIPHKPSHYSPGKTNRLYFKNPDLTIKSIFRQFEEYFKRNTGNTLAMKYKTYFKFFRETEFTFKKPKTDTCDYCRQCELILEKNSTDPCYVQFSLHKKRVEVYCNLKEKYLLAATNDSDTLVLEFDYAQNIPLPKLSITKQFYKRLLWMYMFNVHVHNDDSSFVYTFMESECKKGANSVASFIFDCVQKKLAEYPNMKHIVLMSDGAGGQNKNQTLVRFCSWMSKMYNVEVTHLFPVRGHSFGQCDRNFGVIRNAFKNLQDVEEPQTYLKKILESRQNPSPFCLLHDTSIVFDWDEALKPYFLKTPSNKNNEFRIQQYRVLQYKPCMTVCASKTYYLLYTPFRYAKGLPDHLTLNPMPRVPLKNAKIKDLRDLFIYLHEDNKRFYEKLFQASEQQQVENDNEQQQVDNDNNVNSSGDEVSDEDEL